MRGNVIPVEQCLPLAKRNVSVNAASWKEKSFYDYPKINIFK
jgi:hypothetical protein